VSWDWYVKVVGEALESLGDRAPRVAFVEPFWNEDGLVAANADRVRAALASLTPERAARAELVFTAHAIPNALARTSPYVKQFEETARLVAANVGRAFSTAFQSGPGDAAIPWTGPDISAVMRERAGPSKDFVVSPIGFLCDNVEILYDLDVEARHEAESRGAGFARAATVGSHDAFIATLAERISARAKA
jgi:ferrochelatase